MVRRIAVVAVLLLQGCTVYTGAAMHTHRAAQPEINLDNPVGIIGVEKELYTDQQKVYCEHHSGITQSETGTGYNLCGVKAEIDFLGGE